MTRTLAVAITDFAREYLLRRLANECRDITALETLKSGYLLNLYGDYLTYEGVTKPLFKNVNLIGKPLAASIQDSTADRVFNNIIDGTDYLFHAQKVGSEIPILDQIRDRTWSAVVSANFDDAYANLYYRDNTLGHALERVVGAGNRFYQGDIRNAWYMVSASAITMLEVAARELTDQDLQIELDEDDERWLAELLDWFMLFYPQRLAVSHAIA